MRARGFRKSQRFPTLGVVLGSLLAIVLLVRPAAGQVDAKPMLSLGSAENPPTLVQLGSVRAPEVTFRWLADYLGKVYGAPVEERTAQPEEGKSPALIILADAGSARRLGVHWPAELTKSEAYVFRSYRRDNQWWIVGAAQTEQGLRQAIIHLMREFRQDRNQLLLPHLNLATEPWVSDREVFFLSFPRPQTFEDPGDPADRRLDVQGYTLQQLNQYVDMFHSFGFNGMQIPDSQYIWSVMGDTMAEGRARNHDLFRKLEKRTRVHGGNCSELVIGGAIGEQWRKAYTASKLEPEFEEAVKKWNSLEEKPHDEVEDPFFRQFHSRWYDYYAEVAKDADRIFIHWGEPYSPIKWRSHESKLKMHKFALEHFKRRNPDIITGVNIWAGWEFPDFLDLVERGLFPNRHLFLEAGHNGNWGWEQRIQFRRALANQGYRVGVWGWYLEDMESDQLAFMSVNDQTIKEHYMQVKDRLDPILPTEYQSVLDAAHMVNIYSLYAASRLLWDPFLDTEQLLEEVTDGIWGPRNGPRVLSALKVIRDLRTGATYKYYSPKSHERRLGSPDAKDDLARATAAIETLSAMKPDESHVCRFPLPLSPQDLVELILPNLRQIALFAENRLIVEQIKQAFHESTDDRELRQMESRLKPIGNLGTWVGSFGQVERIYLDRLLNRELIGITRPGARSWDPNSVENPFALWTSKGDPDKAFDGDPETCWFSNYPPDIHSSRPTFADGVRKPTMPPKDLGYAWTEPQTVSRVEIRYINSANAPSDENGVEVQYSNGGEWKKAGIKRFSQKQEEGGNVVWSYEIEPITAKWFRVYFAAPVGDPAAPVPEGTTIESADQPDMGRPAVSEMAFWSGSDRLDTPVERIKLK